jgi:hypothetical protein
VHEFEKPLNWTILSGFIWLHLGVVAKYLSPKNRNIGLEKQGLRKPYNDHIDSDEAGEDPLKNAHFEKSAILRQSHLANRSQIRYFFRFRQ